MKHAAVAKTARGRAQRTVIKLSSNELGIMATSFAVSDVMEKITTAPNRS